MSPTWAGRLRAVAGGALAVGGLLFLAATLAAGWGEAAASLERPALAPLAAALALQLAHTLLMALVWRDLLALRGETAPLRQAYRLVFRSALAKYIPGRVWTLASVATLAPSIGVSAGAAALATTATVLVVAATGLVVGALGYAAWRAELGLGAPIAGVALTAAGAWTAAAALRGRSAHVFRAAGTATASWLVVAASSWAAARALQPVEAGIALPLLVSAALAWVAGLVAPVPAGIGVREAVQVLTLTEVMPSGVAATYALLVRLTLVGSDLIAAALAWGIPSAVGMLRPGASLSRH